MSLTHQQLTRILAPIWIAFERAAFEVETLKEGLEPFDHKTAGQLQEIAEFLAARSRGVEGAGLLDAIVSGAKRFLWPNLYPSPAAKAEAIAAWLERNPAIKEAIVQRKRTQADRLDAAMKRLDEQRAKAYAGAV